MDFCGENFSVAILKTLNGRCTSSNPLIYEKQYIYLIPTKNPAIDTSFATLHKYDEKALSKQYYAYFERVKRFNLFQLHRNVRRR